MGDMTNREGIANRELLIGVVAVVALAANLDTFSLRHFPLGLLLSLFLSGHWQQKGSNHEQICYAAVAGFCGLLTFGFFIQYALFAWNLGHWAEVIYFLCVLFFMAIVFLARRTSANDSQKEAER